MSIAGVFSEEGGTVRAEEGFGLVAGCLGRRRRKKSGRDVTFLASGAHLAGRDEKKAAGLKVQGAAAG